MRRAAILIITSDRGLAGAYYSKVLKEGEELAAKLLREEGKEVVPLPRRPQGRGLLQVPPARVAAHVGRASPSSPTLRSEAREIGDARSSGDVPSTRRYDEGGVDEIHVVFTRFVSMVTQEPRGRSGCCR